MKDKGRKTVTLTQTLLTSKKACLYFCFALIALCDWFLFFSLLYAQMEILYLLIPMVFGILEIVLFFSILLSGFRFRYSMVVPAIYAVLSIGAAGALAVLTFTAPGQEVLGGQHIMTDIAVAIWAGFHLLAGVAVLVSASFAARRSRTAAVFTGILCAVFCAASALYAYHLAMYGFFGQGKGDAFYSYELRTVVYELDEDEDCYEAVSVLAGKGGNVVIPEKYNGKEVKKVNYSLFADETLETVRIENAAFVFSGEENFPQELNETLQISCAKTRVDEFRNALYRVGLSQHNDVRFELASRIVPAVEEGEVYIAFDYTEDSLLRAGGDALATWVEPAGTVFHLSKYNNVSYIRHADNTKEYDLCWSYNNMDGYIFRTLTDEEGTPLDGQKIDHSLTAKAVFGRVYNIRVGEDNDDVYEVGIDYKQFDFDGVRQSGRFVMADSADELLGEMSERDGFTLSWEYERNGSRTAFTSLSTLLETQTAPVIHPVWQMNAPAIVKAETDAASNSTVYGEQVTFTGEATAPADGFALSYEWRYNGVNSASDDTYTIDKITPAQAGQYTFVVKAAAPTISSLASEAEQSVWLTVAKKTLHFDWTIPQGEGLVYSGEEKTVACEPKTEDVVSGDELTYTLTQDTVRDAKQYTIGVQLGDEWQAFYEIAPNDGERSFTITPCSVTVEWNIPAFTYSGEVHRPSATATGVGTDGALDIGVTGEQTHAGENYPVHAYIKDNNSTNYTITNADNEFSIAQKEISVTWDGDREVTYDGAWHTLTAEVHDAVEGEAVTLSYSGGGKNASTEPYTVTASIPEDGNYKFAGDTHSVSETFTIAQRQISLVWQTDTELTYNGGEQGIEVISVTGAVEGEQDAIIAGITYGGYEKDYNSAAYTMSATLPDEGNYKLADGYTATQQFTIGQKEVSFVWELVKQFTYDGKEHGIEVVSVTNVVAADEEGLLAAIVYGEKQKDYSAEPYTMSATIPGEGNYKLAGDTYKAEETFTIVRASLTIVWDGDRRPEYNGDEQGLTPTVEGIVDGEEPLVNQNVKYSGRATNAGTHTMRAELGPSLTNYVIGAGAECSYEITKKVVTLEWQERSFVYSGEKQRPTATVTGTVKEESLTLTFSEGETDVGDNYTVTVTIPEDGNYTFASGYTATQSYTITPAPLTVAWSGDDEVEYDGQYHTLRAEVNGAVHNEEDLVEGHVTVVGSFRDAGEHTVRLQLGQELGNYAITEGETHTLNITKKALTITVQSGSKVYDGQRYTQFAYDHSQLAQGDSMAEVGTVTFTGEAVTATDVGHYTVEAEVAPGAKYNNYTVTTAGSTLDITKAPLTITWKGDKTVEYDGRQHTLTPEASGALLGEEELVSSHVRVVGSFRDVGDRYTVTAKLGAELKNYAITAGETCELNITPKTLTITVTVQGGTKVYDGQPYDSAAFSFTYTALAEGDEIGEVVSVSFTGDALTAVNVGSHRVEASIAGNDKYNNYEVSTVGADITITKKELTITVKTGSKEYDGLPYTGFDYEYTDLAEGDSIGEVVSVSYTGDAFTAVNAGSHHVDATITEGEKYNNYEVSTVGAEITITKKALTISVTAGSKVYDGQPYTEFTYTNTDLATGDTMAEVGTVTYKGDAVEAKDVGRYTVEAEITEQNKGEKYDNYEITFEEATIEITAAEVTLTWPQKKTFEEDGSAQKFEAEADGILEGDVENVHVEYHYYKDGSEVQEPKEPGKYTVRAELVGEGSNNYKLKEEDAESSFEITAQEEDE